MNGDPKSIGEVQEAEAKASKLVEEAKKDGEHMLAAAKEKAAKMVSDAEIAAKAEKADAIKTAIGQLDAAKKKSIEHAEHSSKSVKMERLGVREKELIVKKLADMLLGA